MRKKEKMEIIRATILLGFLKNAHPRIDGKHIPCHDLHKGFPKHERGMAKNARDELIKERFILERRSTRDYSKCSLNHEKIDEILAIPYIIQTVKNDEFLKKHIKKYFKRKI